MVAPFTFRPSAGLPPRESGSYSAKISATRPSSSVSQPTHLMRYAPFKRHSGPLGHSRLYLGTGWVRKSSASTHRFREKVTVWAPSSGRRGLFSTSKVSDCPSG